MDKEELTKIKKQIREHLKELKKVLPQRVDPAFISHKSKVPYKMADALGSLLWRSFELAETAYQSLQKNNIASGILLVRALMETTSMLFYLNSKMKSTIKDKDIDEFDDKIMRILLGSKNKVTEIESINILTTIDKTNKKYDTYRWLYDLLSEYAHPNWLGTHGLYAKIFPNKFYTDYGKNIRNTNIVDSGYSSLLLSLMITVSTYEEIGDISDEFVKLCNENIDKQ
ncbi:hypothetical protein [Sulfurimonas sp.]